MLPPLASAQIAAGFCCFKSPLAEIVSSFTEWQQGILAPLGGAVDSASIAGDLGCVFGSLFPLVSPVRTKCLFIATKTGWTVAFDNGWRGTDAALAPVLSKRSHCEAVRIVAQEHTLSSRSTAEAAGKYGAVIFEVYSEGNATRTVYCSNDGGSWKFGQSGVPFAFEDESAYLRKPTRNRFTLSMLQDYLGCLGIHAFDPDWYHSNGKIVAVISRRTGNPPAGYTEYYESERTERTHKPTNGIGRANPFGK